MRKIEDKEPFWFRLDNAAKIYPVVASAKNSGIYRISAYLHDAIDPQILQTAVLDCRERFPTIFVKLHRGFFWYYFETNPKNPIVCPESPFICQSINVHINNQFQFTFFYYRNRISLEMFHSLADGYGAFTFMKAVVYRYLEIKGCTLINDGSIFECNQTPKDPEFEDAYNRYYTKTKPPKKPFVKAYRIKGKRFKRRGINLTLGHVKTAQLQRTAATYGVSMTEFLVGLYMRTILSVGKPEKLKKHPISISVPVNMRQYLPSESLRNFSLFFNVKYQFENEIPSLDSMLQYIKQQFVTGKDINELRSLLNLNVRFEKSTLIRVIPLALKKFFFKVGYALLGDLPITTSVTNLGTIKVPESMEREIEGIEVNLASGKKPGLALVSYSGITSLAMNRCFIDSSIEQVFFSELAALGVPVEIQSNYWE
ncbi:MAG: hypothetical protein JXR38_04605 [Bacilli bacterium]|nr:hypothetical protein [Bacilli bacterium]